MRLAAPFVALAALASVAGPAPAQTADRPAVIELYTSQGCSSCPPADALLAKVGARSDVIALALHVDYWDYIGWKDTFGAAAFAERQRNYARAAGEKMIYTPQMVVNGQSSIAGSDAGALAALLAPAGGAAGPDLTIRRDGATLRIRGEAREPLSGPALVELVRFIPEVSVAVGRGENAGRTITYTHIVTGWRTIGEWDGSAPLSLDLTLKGDDAAAVLIQEPGPGAILAAASAR